MADKKGFSYENAYGEKYDDCEIVKRGNRDNVVYSIVSASQGSLGHINSVIEEVSYFKNGNEPEGSVVAIKDYSENVGMYNFLKNAGVIKNDLGTLHKPFCSYPIVELDVDKLMKLGKEVEQVKPAKVEEKIKGNLKVKNRGRKIPQKEMGRV